jgi:hypothetical protein
MINITQKIEKFVITENFTEREIQVFRLELAGHFIFIDNFWRAFEQHYANMR